MAQTGPISKRFNLYGGADVLIYDDYDDTWMSLGSCQSPSWTPAVERVQQQFNIRGRMETVAERITSVAGNLTFQSLEVSNPALLDLIFNPAADQTIENAESVVSETVKFNAAIDEVTVPHYIGLATAANLASLTIGTTTAGSTGGTIPADTYYVWTIPCYGVMPSTPVTTDKDRTWIMGTPKASNSPIAVTLGQKISVQITAITGPAPDFFICVLSKSNSITAGKIASVSSTVVGATYSGAGSLPATITIGLLSGNAYSASNYVYARAYTTYADGASTFQVLTEGTDYTFGTNGAFKRIATSTNLPIGKAFQVTYWYIKPPSVTTDLGTPTCNENYRKIKIVQVEPYECEADPDNLREVSTEIIFERVNLAALAPAITFQDNQYYAGSEFSMGTMQDSATGRIGTWDSANPDFSGYMLAS